MDILRRNNVSVVGNGKRTIVFAHGFGCDKTAWDAVLPAFADRFTVISYDHVGAGGSDLSAFDPAKYSSLKGYATDLLDILRALDLHDIIYVGHSVAGIVGMLASIDSPDRFASLVMLCASPHYIDETGYIGGFSREDLDELLEVVDSNFLGWSRQTTPAIMGNPERPELGVALGDSFCRTDPDIARHFARVTFLSDHRQDLPLCHTPTLVLQTRADMVVPQDVGPYMVAHMLLARLHVMEATGHCPHISAAAETIAAIGRFVEG